MSDLSGAIASGKLDSHQTTGVALGLALGDFARQTLGEQEQAERNLATYRDLLPDDDARKLAEAEIAYQHRDFQKARTAISALSDDSRTAFPPVLERRAQAALGLGDYTAAAKDIAQAIKAYRGLEGELMEDLGVKPGTFRFPLATALIAQAERLEAEIKAKRETQIALLREVCEGSSDHQAALKACTELIDGFAGPPRLPALAQRAQLHLAVGALDQTLSDLDLSQHESASPDTMRDIAYIRYYKAVLEAGDFSVALASFGLLLETLPGDAQGLLGRALTHSQLGNFGSALADAESVLGKDPQNLSARLARAEILARMGNYEAAHVAAREAVSIDPSFPQGPEVLGDVLLARGDTAAAVELYRRAIQLLVDSSRDRRPPMLDALRLKDVRRKLDGAGRALLAGQTEIAHPQKPEGERRKDSDKVVSSQRRVALVVGNSHYSDQAALRNPSNDAAGLAGALKRLGFDVVEGFDLTKVRMSETLREFARRVRDADVGLVYYAGHAIQYQGENYLVPVDARIEDETDVEHELVHAGRILKDLARASGARVLILDSCRDNPLQAKLASLLPSNRSISAGRGLARLDRASDGFIIVYATQAGAVAEDGSGANSPFTAALLANLEQRGVELVQLFRRVAQKVKRDTGGRQSPEMSLSLTEEVFLAGP